MVENASPRGCNCSISELSLGICLMLLTGVGMRAIVIAAALLLAGCASIQSRSAQTGGEGWAYAAPMRRVAVTATREQHFDAGTQLRIDRARAALTMATTASTRAQTALETATNEAAVARATADAAADAQKAEAERTAQRKASDVVNARRALDQARAREAELETALSVLLTAASTDNALWQERVVLAPGAAEADPRVRFAGDLNESVFRTDRGIFRVGGNSLLQSNTFTSEGALDESIVAIAEGIVAVATAGAPGPESASDPRPSCTDGNLGAAFTPARVRDESLTYTIDPVDAAQVTEVNQALCQLGFSYRLQSPSARAGGAEVAIPPCPQRKINGSQTYVCNGLVYRQNEPVRMLVRRISMAATNASARQEGAVSQSIVFNIPNAAPLNVVPYGSSLFVTRRTDVTFSDGSLVQVDYDHPSEVATAAGIPLRVLQATARTIAEVVRLRIDVRQNRERLQDEDATPPPVTP